MGLGPLSGVKEAMSHPQALGQCRLWLREHGIQPLAYPDTAGAAAVVAERQVATRGHVPFIVGVDAVGPLGLGIGIAAGDGLSGVKGHQIGPQIVEVRPRRTGREAEADLHLVVEVPVDVGAGEHQHVVIGRGHESGGR
eukprot:gene47212-63985_t